MPSASFSVEESPGSLEQIRTSEYYPKSSPQRISSDGEVGPPSEENVIPFPLLPGECLLRFGDISTKTRMFLTNFRIFIMALDRASSFQNIPLLNIDSVEMRDMFYLLINCKDGHVTRIFADNNASCMVWFKELNGFASGAETRDKIFAYRFYVWCTEEKRTFALQLRPLHSYVLPKLGPLEIPRKDASIKSEFRRIGLSDSLWRISDANANHKLCESYPEFTIVPKCTTDIDLERSAQYRCLNRFPSFVWHDPITGAVLLRSSQPGVGLLGWRSPEDERLLNDFATTAARSVGLEKEIADMETVCDSSVKTLLILDARSYTAGWANRAKGGGFESPENYRRCEVQFMGMANIHAIRNSFQQLRNLLWTDTPDSAVWFQALQGTQWVQNLSSLMAAAVRVCEALRDNGRSVLVHCSDGWDRTSQIVALTKIMMDPFYRTMTGFRELVEREWVEFGHKFADRCGVVNGCPLTERAPVFLQWLDGIHQLLLQFPSAFQFNHSYLVKLAQHCYSGLFGSFLHNSSKEARENLAHVSTFSVWAYLHPDNVQFRNVIYEETTQLVWPRTHVKDLVLWHEVFSLTPAWEDSMGERKPSNGALSSTNSMDRSLQRAHSFNSLPSVEFPPQLPRTGSDSHLAQPPGPDSHITQPATTLLEGASSKEEVAQLLEQVVLQASLNGVSEERFNGVDASPVKLEGNTHENGVSLALHFSNGVVIDDENNAVNGLDEGGGHMSTSTSDISDSFVRRIRAPSQFLCFDAGQADPADSLESMAGSSVRVIRPGQKTGEVKRVVRSSRNKIADFIDRDGLTLFLDPLQDSTRAMRENYEQRIEVLENKLQQVRRIRNGSVHANGFSCPVCVLEGEKRLQGEGGAAGSSDSGGGRSDLSWDAVDENDAQPTRWIPDHAVSHCMGCDSEFWAINRRHHCRSCGKVFCSACSSFESPVPSEQLYEPVRVCHVCYTNLSGHEHRLSGDG